MNLPPTDWNIMKLMLQNFGFNPRKIMGGANSILKSLQGKHGVQIHMTIGT
jgi:hypothetical protein